MSENVIEMNIFTEIQTLSVTFPFFHFSEIVF